MKTLFTSELVERLGWTLLHSSWQIALIALTLLLSRILLRTPNLRYLAAMLALLASIAWPVASFLQQAPKPLLILMPTLESKAPEELLPVKVSKQSPLPSKPLPKLDKSTSYVLLSKLGSLNRRLSQLMPWTVVLWLMGVCLLAMRQAGALWTLHRLRTRDVSEVSARMSALFAHTKTRLGLNRAVRLVCSARVLAPVVIGSMRPVVLMPASLLSGLPTEQLEALIAHELAHLRRWDDVANLLQCAIETLLFYHPAVWWISRRIREDRELCCDDFATARGIERSTLAQALGKLAIWQSDLSQPSLAATGHMPVLSRIKRLLQPAPTGLSVNGWPLALVIATAVCLTVMNKASAEAPPRGRILDRNGEVLADCTKNGDRYYPHKSLASHIIGYTSPASPKEKRLSGRAGIEVSMETELWEKRDVQLTLDLKVQKFAEASLHLHARRGGAAVIMDANTGDILAMASSPTFDLNDFVPRITESKFKEYNTDKSRPILGRAFQGNYNPASIFKLVTGLAALKSGAVDEKTLFDGVASYQIEGRDFHNWNKEDEGAMNIVGAIKRSCNTWFYQAALKTGAQPITDMAQQLGFGEAAEIPLKNAKGFLPTDEYYMKRDGKSIPTGILAEIAIGQIVTATPLQTTIATAAIANGGKVLRPRLIKSDAPPQYVNDLIANGLRPEHLELIKKGMVAVVDGEGGTGHNARVEGLSIAGKTGTAQVHVDVDDSKSTRLAWFIGFAPVDHPQIAFSIVYEGAPGEHVSGGSIAAPIAQEIIAHMRDEKMFKGVAPVKKTASKPPMNDSMLEESWLRNSEVQLLDKAVVFYQGTKINQGKDKGWQFKGEIVFVKEDGMAICGKETELEYDADGKLRVRGITSTKLLKTSNYPVIEEALKKLHQARIIPERTPIERESSKPSPQSKQSTLLENPKTSGFAKSNPQLLQYREIGPPAAQDNLLALDPEIYRVSFGVPQPSTEDTTFYEDVSSSYVVSPDFEQNNLLRIDPKRYRLNLGTLRFAEDEEAIAPAEELFKSLHEKLLHESRPEVPASEFELLSALPSRLDSVYYTRKGKRLDFEQLRQGGSNIRYLPSGPIRVDFDSPVQSEKLEGKSRTPKSPMQEPDFIEAVRKRS